MKRIYLDHNATTPQAPEVTEAMRPFFEECFGNPSSTHLHGQQARSALEKARSQVADFLEASPEEIVFTGGGTEAINLAILGTGRIRGQGHVVTTAMEHLAALEACRRLEAEGLSVTYLRPDAHGRVDPEAVFQAVRPDTILISVMHANNETGVLQPVAAIVSYCRERGIQFHTDAIQSAGKVPLSVRETPVDLLSLAAHKFRGPKGVGALYVRGGVRIQPLLFGGGQEGSYRSGTEAVALAVGMGKASELARSYPPRFALRILPLREELERDLLESVPGCGVNGAGAPRLPNTSSICFPGSRGEELMIRLDLDGIAVSTGSACSTGTNRPSHVLLAMGLDPERVRSAVRFSLGLENRRGDIGRLLRLLPGAIPGLRGSALRAVAGPYGGIRSA